MFPLNLILLFTLLCGQRVVTIGSTTAGDSTDDFPIIGGFTDLNEKELLELHSKLILSSEKLAEKYDKFDLIVKKVLSGKSQTVAGTNYVVNVQMENAKKESNTCEAEIWEKLWENFLQVQLKCQDKHYSVEIIPAVIIPIKPIITVLKPRL